MSITATSSGGARPFHHEALLYRGPADLAGAATGFIGEGLVNDEEVLVAATPATIGLLRDALGGTASSISFADMTEVGLNPATILPLWADFAEHSLAAGRVCRGISETVWSTRRPAALVECRQHETLLNVAFAAGPGWHLLCLFDAERLADAALADGLSTHPLLHRHGAATPSPDYDHVSARWSGFGDPLPLPATRPSTLQFGDGSLRQARSFVEEFARHAGVNATQVDHLLLAVNEIVANSIRHGGGGGVLRLWCEDDTLLCEVADRGTITDPFVGRRRPTADQDGGRGLWIANHSCDLVQVRSSQGQTVVRMHTAL